ncbi:MAG TPA: prepilin-type N-terminal cleavage/methylation domain-containing protein [Rhodoferax sp.]|jgi:general secretion pathway protein J|nr:prepilin-type N-terminal cleavage/methylation domain-containing protein [Rhodoferax sp.]
MRSQRSSGQSIQKGFTLLELLISITLLGMILVLLFGGLRLGVRSWDAVQQQVDNLNTVRSVESFLRREMSQTQPYRWKAGTGQRLAFVGERNKVNFVAQLPARIGGGGLYAISLEIESDANGKRLVWRHVPLSPLVQDFTAVSMAPKMILAGAELSAVDDIWLTYFGRLNDSTAPAWLDRWESDTRLPMLIKVQVRFFSGSEWPDFVVAPLLASEGAR